jgi:hypothetical protein
MWRSPRHLFLAALICIQAGPAHADSPAPRIPDSPAGHAFSAWLVAINGADPASQESFLTAHPSWMTLESLAKWSAGTGGYELLEVYSSDPTNVFFHVKQRRSAVEEVGRLQVSAAQPERLEALGAWRMPAGAKFAPVTLDEATRARVIEFAAREFVSSYVDPEIGKKMSVALREYQTRGEYRDMRYGDVFAKKLTGELRKISNDKHVEVRFSYFVKPAESPASQAEGESRRMAAINCGFEHAEHRPPNIGYLKFNMFADPAICASTAGAAMTYLADSDALIIDLRDNRGGNPEMALLIASYLFDARTHLADTFDRAGKTATETWTLPTVPGRKFVGKPVFVLTSKGTFSAAEAVSYYLQALKRGTVIGETTAGGGHLTKDMPIDDHFLVRVPYAKSTSPITKAGWDGTGVEPDVKVPASGALDVALKLASEAISKKIE